MHGELRLFAQDFHGSSHFAHEDFLAGLLPGNRIAIAFPTHEGVAGHAPDAFHNERIGMAGGGGLQCRFLFLPRFSDDAMRRSMDTNIGDLSGPPLHLVAQIL